MGDNATVSGGYFVRVGDCQRSECKADGSNEAADCYDILYETWMTHTCDYSPKMKIAPSPIALVDPEHATTVPAAIGVS